MFNFQFYPSERFLKRSREGSVGSVGGHCLFTVHVPVYGHFHKQWVIQYKVYGQCYRFSINHLTFIAFYYENEGKGLL